MLPQTFTAVVARALSFALALALSLALPLALASCAADPATHVPPLQPAPAELTAAQVSQRYDHAFAVTPALRLRQRAYEQGRANLTSDSWMDRTRVRTDVFDGPRCVYSFTVEGQHVQEFVPTDGRVATQESDTRGWLDYPKLVPSSWGCQVGSAFGTWLVDNCRMRLTLTERIAHSTLAGTAIVDGRECAVIVWEDEFDAEDPEQFRQGATYYVDLERGWMLRADQYQETNGRRIQRVLLMDVQPLPSIEDSRLDLGPDRQ